jgi:hypothetical protein
MNSTELHLHHAQAPAVLNHSRTLPQGDGGAQAARKVKWVLVVVIQAEKRNAAELVGDMKGPRSSWMDRGAALWLR